MADVHEIYTPRRRRIWPTVVMFLLIVLLIGIVVAMIMNVRGTISWPAGGLQFGFRPNIYVTRIESAAEAAAPTRVATDISPAAKAPVPDLTPPTAVETPSAPPQPVPAGVQNSQAVDTSQPAETQAVGSPPPAEFIAPQ
jgi:hypothetical protein